MNHGNKATLILGAGGFLGRKIYNLMIQDGSVYKPIRGAEDFLIDSRDSKASFSSLAKYDLLHVINCSSGRLQSLQEATNSNYTFPAAMLKKVMSLPVLLEWTQFDSYTQYSLGEIHDKNYVLTKNMFNGILDSHIEDDKVLRIKRVSLPHLYGDGDSLARFLPKMFWRILLGEDVKVLSPKELLPVIDANDCAQIVIEMSLLNLVSPDNRKWQAISISPSEILRAYDLLLYFKKIAGSPSKLTMGESINGIFTEKWKTSEQPPVFQSSLIRTSRSATLEKIRTELKGLL